MQKNFKDPGMHKQINVNRTGLTSIEHECAQSSFKANIKVKVMIKVTSKSRFQIKQASYDRFIDLCMNKKFKVPIKISAKFLRKGHLKTIVWSGQDHYMVSNPYGHVITQKAVRRLHE